MGRREEIYRWECRRDDSYVVGVDLWFEDDLLDNVSLFVKRKERHISKLSVSIDLHMGEFSESVGDPSPELSELVDRVLDLAERLLVAEESCGEKRTVTEIEGDMW